MEVKPKKVTVLTGFLGAGKTTLLNAILSHNKNTRFAIIENEVGEIGIDGDLIIKNTDSFAELNNGCICCSLNENFLDTLKQLSQRTDWDELIIEATGVAEPGGILKPFKLFPWLAKYFLQPVVICIGDAINIPDQLTVSETAGSQLAYGDVIYLSKTDLADTKQVGDVVARIKQFNPFAHIVTGSKAAIPIAELQQERRPVIPVLQIPDNVTVPDQAQPHDDYEALAFEFDEAFDANKLYSRLDMFLAVQSANVYRFKGVIYDPVNPNKLIVQSVMKSLFMEEFMPWEQGEPKVSRLVFIGKHLQRKGYEKMLRSCLRNDAEQILQE